MDFTTGTAPWWYVAALAGGFTVLGGLISVLSSFLSDRRRIAHDDARRYDDDLREYAASFMNSLIAARDNLKLLRKESSGVDTEDSAMHDKRIADTENELKVQMRAARLTLDELTIVAPAAVRDSARRFYIYLHYLRRAPGSDLWDKRFWTLLNEFISAVRRAVGLPEIEGPKGSWITEQQ